MKDGILELLILEGKITAEDVERIEDTIMTPEKERVIETFHSVLCKRDHDTGECKWYVEEQYTDAWKKPFHLKWAEFVVGTLRRMEVSFTQAETLVVGMGFALAMTRTNGEKALALFLLSPDLSKFVPEVITENSTGSGDNL